MKFESSLIFKYIMKLHFFYHLRNREGLEVTDDVSIVEHLKHPVYITQGSYTNIKVELRSLNTSHLNGNINFATSVNDYLSLNSYIAGHNSRRSPVSRENIKHGNMN